MAVKGKDKIEILNNFRQRINNNIEFEFEESKKQVKKLLYSDLMNYLQNETEKI